ncbi:MAG TPA: class I SAM-dependent methyltransferase [Bryobacteraceae bacterium]|jgi:SAM-dependent methyltransferase|nr:class I SAM-dependent methyltransferase [Bryobacteraceae bacterium]
MPELDPVAAYDLLAPSFSAVSKTRERYLRAIEDLIVSAAPKTAASMLDIGSGDGRRALQIARQLGIRRVTLLEPSATMRAHWPDDVEGWYVRVEELGSKAGNFDLITCLWNVLGHVFPTEARLHALEQMRRLLTANGRLFMDVSHRYNMLHYGRVRTLLRMLRDRFGQDWLSGDVSVRWEVAGGNVHAKGHVFTAAELEALARAAGLQIEHRFVVDYATGELRRSKYQGHLLYQCRRSA